MAVLAWNDRELEVAGDKVYTFTGWSSSSSFKTEEKKNGKKMPKSEAVSPGRGSVSFEVALSYALGVDVEGEYLWWRDECMKGTESLMYFGYKQFGSYKWRLVGVDQSELRTLRDGLWISCRMTLTFEESYCKVRLSKLEKRAKKLAKKLERLTKRAINAKSQAARDKLIQKAAATRSNLRLIQIAAADEKASKVKAERETRKAIVNAIISGPKGKAGTGGQ